jgi:ankyrin repeat protein
MLAFDPALAGANIVAAAAAGDATAVREFLVDDSTLANAFGGPFPWPPLLYACYSRRPPAGAHSTLEVARVLLGAGADPNAGFLWCGCTPAFTALTGAFGEGENGNNQPPHPERDALARLLLEAGADPNDGQTLYNRHFRADDGHLELLLEYGLSDPDLLREELWFASRKKFIARVKLLVDGGAPVDLPSNRDGLTPFEAALSGGNHEIAEYLVAHGATQRELAPNRQLAAAALAGRREEAAAVLARHPELHNALGQRGRVELVQRAVEASRPEGVRVLAQLGFELADDSAATPMHQAAWKGDLEMVRLLVELGASTTATDPQHHATPLGWAEHNQQLHVADFLRGKK